MAWIIFFGLIWAVLYGLGQEAKLKAGKDPRPVVTYQGPLIIHEILPEDIPGLIEDFEDEELEEELQLRRN
jgi:hypothetical protein